MAEFQNVVNIKQATGIPGANAAINPTVSTPLGYIAKAQVTVGAFCWEDTTYEGQVNPGGSGMPLGFVVRNFSYSVTGDTNKIPVGGNVNVAIEGDFFVQPAASVTKGQKVFANTTTGLVSGASAGSTVSGAVETNWAFTTSCGAGEIAIISNHGQTPVDATVMINAYTKTESDAKYVTGVAAGDNNYELKVTKNGTDSTVEIGHA